MNKFTQFENILLKISSVRFLIFHHFSVILAACRLRPALKSNCALHQLQKFAFWSEWFTEYNIHTNRFNLLVADCWSEIPAVETLYS